AQTIVTPLGIHELRVGDHGVAVKAQLLPGVPTGALGDVGDADHNRLAGMPDDVSVRLSNNLLPLCAPDPVTRRAGVIENISETLGSSHQPHALVRVSGRAPPGEAVEKGILNLLGGAVDEDVVFDDIVLPAVNHHGATVGVDHQIAVDVDPARIVIEVNAPAVVWIFPNAGFEHVVTARVMNVIITDDAAAFVDVARTHADGPGIGLFLVGVVHVVVLNDIAHPVEGDALPRRVMNEVVRDHVVMAGVASATRPEANRAPRISAIADVVDVIVVDDIVRQVSLGPVRPVHGIVKTDGLPAHMVNVAANDAVVVPSVAELERVCAAVGERQAHDAAIRGPAKDHQAAASLRQVEVPEL